MPNKTLPVNNQVLPSGIFHGFDTGYAIAYGVDEAIMIRNLQWFITANANRGHNFHEGRFWTYDRLDDFLAHFPYWSKQSIRRILASLIKQNVILKGEFNQIWSLRTQWYAFVDQERFIPNIKIPETPAPVLNIDMLKSTSQEKIFENPHMLKSTSDRCRNQHLTNVENDICILDTSSITTAISSSSSLKVSEQPAEAIMPAKAAEAKKKKSSIEFSEEVEEVHDKMIGSLQSVKEDYRFSKAQTLAVMTSIDLMIRLDGRTAQKILDVFRWAVNDSFWQDKMFKPNPAKYLREKFDQLEMKMNAKAPEQKSNRRFAEYTTDKEKKDMAAQLKASFKCA